MFRLHNKFRVHESMTKEETEAPQGNGKLHKKWNEKKIHLGLFFMLYMFLQQDTDTFIIYVIVKHLSD